MGILKKLFSKLNEFSVTLYCKNCGANNTYWFPEGTHISRAPYLGYPNAESTAIIRGPCGVHPRVERRPLKCKVCKVGNVA